MGGAGDLPQRSSSPMKRRASDLEGKPETILEDVDMVAPASPKSLEANPPEQAEDEDFPFFFMGEDTTEYKRFQSNPAIGSRGVGLDRTSDVLPSIDEQIATVTQILESHNKVPLKVGEKAYMISNTWLKRVQDRSSTAKATDKAVFGEEIGPIDNSDIFQEILQEGNGENFVRLRPGLGRLEFEWFPEEAWQYVFGLYGLKDGQVPIIRKTFNTNPDTEGLPNIEYERDPPLFVIHRLWSANSPIPLPQILKAQNPKAPIFVFSRNDLYVDLLRRIKTAAGVEMPTKIQLWKVPRNFNNRKSIAASIANEASPPVSRGNTPSPESQSQPQDTWTHLLLDVETFLKLEKKEQRLVIEHQDLSDTDYKGSMTVQMAGLEVEQALVIDEKVETDFLSRYVRSQYVPAKSNVAISTTRLGATLVKSASDSGRTSPAPSGPMTRGRALRSGRAIGTVGLSNLGNTCYMNSALQCVRSVEELTKYFLTKQAAEEINRDNPLGNNGQVADAYNDLLQQIYRDPPQSTVVPRQFKTTIGRIVPSFSGYGQQDSQEFLGFLLDGLQEDLSRIKKKPYIEKPDSTDEMVGNPEAIREMAAKVWDITKRRDDSVIADLFTGMYKSTLVCPVCDKVSITFDPFNNLTLQLPIENTWSHEIYFFPLNDKPVRIAVDMDKQASIKVLKEFVSKRTNVPVERLFIGEEFKCRFYKYYDDMKPVSEEIQPNDMIALYELESAPTNWPAPKKPAKQKVRSMLTFSHFDSNDEDDVPNWNDPMAERMLVPVLHRQPAPENPRYRKPWQHAIVPHFIIVNADEARNEDAIRRKLLEKVATFTTNAEFHREDEEDDDDDDVNDGADPDLLVTTSSDADSAGDSKVVATSIDGDEELVDVKMKDPQEIRDSIESDADGSVSLETEQKNQSRKTKFRIRRPKWVDPKIYLPPAFQNLFDISYFTGSKELVPVGWGAVDEDKSYPLISSRIPQPNQDVSDDEEELEQDGTYSGDFRRTPSEVGSSDAEEDDAPQLAPTRMMDESSSDDEDITNNISRVLPVRPVAQRVGIKADYNRRRNRGIKTYSRKGTKLSSHGQSLDGAADEAPEEGPLIRLGEGIVVDWNRDAYEALFNGPEGDAMRGGATWIKIPIMDDPELTAKRNARMNRKKKGLSLEECLDEFGKEEILSEMDTWYCPRCKEHRRASKKFELWKTPDILVMHLKRFSSNAMRRDKLDVAVDFPIEGLDLTSRVVEKEDGKQEIYDLFAVDDHWGGLGGGHYTAFAKSWVDNEWYEYNDSSVSKQKDTSRIVSHGAYLLFYRRRSEVPLGGPRFQHIFELYDKSLEESDDESAESGEGQRLAGDSSLNGSSGALIGVGAAHQQVGGFLGGAQMTRSQAMPMSSMMHSVDVAPQITINPADLDKPPAYEVHGDDDIVPLLPRDEEMNDLDVDEGVDMNMGYSSFDSNQQSTNPLIASWTFDNITTMGNMQSKMMNQSSATSDIDLNDASDRSDLAAHNSSASEGSIAGRINDFANAEPDEGEWEQPEPIPDMSDEAQAAIYGLHEDLLAAANMNTKLSTKGLNQVPPESIMEDVDEEAAEIRVEEDEGLKMD